MATIAANLQAVRDRIACAAGAAGRSADDIALIAVSKTCPASLVAEACASGQRAFGENQAQEGVRKVAELTPLLLPLEWHVAHGQRTNQNPHGDGLPSSGVASPEGPLLPPLEWHVAHGHRTNQNPHADALPSSGVASPEGPLLLPLEWHFIGPIQSNKTRAIAEHFHWVHGIERGKIAVRLNDARPADMPPLEVCIQVNVSGEASKSGVAPGEEIALAEAIMRLPRLRLRGLMAIPAPTADRTHRRRQFARLRELKDALVARGYALDTLSMGMSDDLEDAIGEGATLVRVGTAIFGSRKR